MTIQTLNIPRVCVCSPSRSGSSMMMQVLIAGGLTVDYEQRSVPPYVAPNTAQLMRQPYGMFENTQAVTAGIYINSFKLMRPELFSQVPTDYKFIWAGRNLAEIQASWTAVSVQYSKLPGIPDAAGLLSGALSATDERYNAWQAVISANPNLFLQLDYDQTCANPVAMAASVANFIQSSEFPNFTFNQVAAAAAVDTNLYINRGA